MDDEGTALYNVLKEIFLLLDDGDRHLLATYDLTVPRFYALFHLGENPDLSVSELSALMFCDKSNVTRLAQSLEAENLVQRRPHKHDGRITCLSLTPAGKELRQKALTLHHQHNETRFGAVLAPEAQKQLQSTLRDMRDGLQRDLTRRKLSNSVGQ
jgi:MarR family transcriptional regulator, organic hydroperoxide resistance regulator